MFNKPQLALSIVLPLISGVTCCYVIAQDGQPLDRRDGLPTGGGSAEAAACDMVRAMVNRSYAAFKNSTPIVKPSSKTENDYVNHYVSLVTDTTFRSEDGVVTAHALLSLQRMRLKLQKVSLPVAIDPPLRYHTHGVLWACTRESFVDVTVTDSKTGKEFTTRMMVVLWKNSGEWKAYPVSTTWHKDLLQAIDHLEIAEDDELAK